MFGGTRERVVERTVPGTPTAEPTRQAAAAAPPPQMAMARAAQGAMGRSGTQPTSSTPRTQSSLVGSTSALTRKPNLQRRTLIGGVS